MRSPFGARPHCRVIEVVTPLSSRKISLSGGIATTVARNSSQLLAVREFLSLEPLAKFN
jgi:hypothetical protein